MTPREPTGDECNTNALIYESEAYRYYAIWYPQMGGYVGKAVAACSKKEPGGCIDVWVWHDGDFPFTGDGSLRSDGSPTELHHCNPEQFVQFGKKLMKLDSIEDDGGK